MMMNDDDDEWMPFVFLFCYGRMRDITGTHMGFSFFLSCIFYGEMDLDGYLDTRTSPFHNLYFWLRDSFL